MKESLGMRERGAIQELPSRRILRTGGRGLGGPTGPPISKSTLLNGILGLQTIG